MTNIGKPRRSRALVLFALVVVAALVVAVGSSATATPASTKKFRAFFWVVSNIKNTTLANGKTYTDLIDEWIEEGNDAIRTDESDGKPDNPADYEIESINQVVNGNDFSCATNSLKHFDARECDDLLDLLSKGPKAVIIACSVKDDAGKSIPGYHYHGRIVLDKDAGVGQSKECLIALGHEAGHYEGNGHLDVNCNLMNPTCGGSNVTLTTTTGGQIGQKEEFENTSPCYPPHSSTKDDLKS